MGAPTGYPESDEILSRLQNVLDDTPPEPANPEDSRETTEEVKVTPPDDAPAQGEPEGETAPATTDGDAEGEAEVSGSEEASAAETGEEEIRTMADLAKMFEVEEDTMLQNLEVDAGDGETVPLSKVISTYKTAPEAAKKWEEFQAREAAFAAESAQLRIKTDEAVRDLAVHAQVLLDMTNEEFKGVDWNKLKDEEPAQYLFMKERQRERGEAIQAAIEKMKGLEGQRVEEMQQKAATTRASEIAKLHQKMPDWVDQAVAQAAMNETSAFLTEAGFSQEEINSITDHRYLLVAYDAAQYRKIKNQAPEKLDKLRGLPKPKAVLRSTARRDSRDDAQRNAKAKLDRLKETGDERDAARIFEELL